MKALLRASGVLLLAGVNLAAGVAAPVQAHAANTCSVKVNDPHFSDGADGVIAKIRVNCTGFRTEYRVRGFLGGGPRIGPPGLIATIDRDGGETLVARTFYVPRRGVKGLRCSSRLYYSASATITLENGRTFSGRSNRVTGLNCS